MAYSIRYIAETTGLTAHVIRIWERRYRLLTPQRAPNGYRIYSDDDLQLLLYLKAQTDAGQSIGQLAQVGLSKLRDQMTHTPISVPGVPENLRQHALNIVQSARVPDARGVALEIRRTASQLGLKEAIEQVFFPVIRAVGELWHRGEIGNAGEQVITHATRQEIVQALCQSNSRTAPTVVVACAPREFHEIAAMTSALYLQHAGWYALYLGPDASIDVLQIACERHVANLAVLSITYEQPRRTMSRFIDLLSTRILPVCPIIVGGEAVVGYEDLLQQRGIYVVKDLKSMASITPQHPMSQRSGRSVPSPGKQRITNDAPTC